MLSVPASPESTDMLNIARNYSLLGHNTFGIDARTAVFVEYGSEPELQEAARMLREGALPSPWLHIGGGSNLLLTRDWPGTVLHSAIRGCDVVSEGDGFVEVRAGSGVVWDGFVGMCVEHGWYGAENLSAIPGEVGAAAVQNIGAYGVEVKDLILEVEAMDMTDGQKRIFQAADCGYGYRRSIFKQQENRKYVVLSVLFRLGLRPHFNLGYKALAEALAGRDNVSLRDVREAVMAVRSSKLPDPSETGSAGSFFTNPVVSRDKLAELQRQWPAVPFYEVRDNAGSVKLSAGWLIEQSGWKGRSLGRAGVWPRQALVLVNLGGADGREIVALADAVRASVRDRFGVELRPEVNII